MSILNTRNAEPLKMIATCGKMMNTKKHFWPNNIQLISLKVN
jgi:hypothetical protein